MFKDLVAVLSEWADAYHGVKDSGPSAEGEALMSLYIQ
jgi:hypothetical protein